MAIRKLTIEEVEKMTNSKYVVTSKLKLRDKEIFGDNKYRTIEFQVFDGFAYCADFEGHSYCMTFPRKDFVRMSKELSNNLRAFLKIETNEPLNELQILSGYYKLHKIA